MKTYTMRFGSGDPRTYTGVGATFLLFKDSAGNNVTPPGITEIPSSTGLYYFNWGTTTAIAFLADAATTSPGTTGRYVTGQLDQVDRGDEYGITLTAIGSSLVALGTTAVAIGTTHVAQGTTISALGTTAVALGTTAVSYGLLNNGLGTTGVALGTTAVSYGLLNNQQGSTIVALGTTSVSYGSANNALGTTAVAIGTTNLATTTAYGNTSVALGITNVAIGTTGVALGVTSIALGTTSIATTTAYGNTSVALGTTGIAIGTTNVAIGTTITAIASSLVALGQSSALFAFIGSTASSFGTSAADPVDLFGFMKRVQENLEGGANYTKIAGTWAILARSGSLLITKTISNGSTNILKS